MAERYSEEWFAAALEAATDLPEVPGVSFVFDAEITEAPGKVRAHGRVVNGRLTSLVPGKFVAEHDDETVQVTFAGKGKRLAPVLDGEVPPLLAFMRGELKVDGEYQLVVDDLANKGDRSALEAFRAAVANVTD